MPSFHAHKEVNTAVDQNWLWMHWRSCYRGKSSWIQSTGGRDIECSGYLLRYPCTPNSEISVFQHITWGCQVWGSDSQKPVWELQSMSCMSLQPDCNPTAPSMLVHREHRHCLNPIPICQLSHQVMRRGTSSNSKYSTDGVVFFLRLKIPSTLLEEGMTHKLFKLQKATVIFSCVLYIELK